MNGLWKMTTAALLAAVALSTAQAAPEDGAKEKMKERMLKRFDTDGNGTLSESEKAAMKAARAETLAKYDTDGDGKLSPAEREAMPKPGEKKGKGKKPSAE